MPSSPSKSRKGAKSPIKNAKSPIKLSTRHLDFGWIASTSTNSSPASSTGLSPKPKQKLRKIPPTGVALHINSEGQPEIVPQLSAQYTINDEKCSKVLPLRKGDRINLRNALSFRLDPKTKDKKLSCNLPTAETAQLKEEKEQMKLQLEEEKKRVNEYKSELELEKEKLLQEGEKTKEELQKLEEQKLHLEEESKLKIEEMEKDAKKRLLDLEEQQRRKEEEIKAEMAKLDEEKNRMIKEQEDVRKQQEEAMRLAEEEHQKQLGSSLEEKEKLDRAMKHRESQLQALERVLDSAIGGDSDVTIKDVHEILADIMGVTRTTKNRQNMVYITVKECQNLKDNAFIESHSPYVQMIVKSRSCKTTAVKGTLDPKWESGNTFFFRVEPSDDIILKVFDADPWSSDVELGKLTVQPSSLSINDKSIKEYDLDTQGKIAIEWLYCVYD